MAEHVIKLPDVGEGIAEAELVEWHVKVGDVVREDMVLAAVMTDKATVEIPSPIDGKVQWLGAEIGESIAVGSDLVHLEVAGKDVPPQETEAKPVVVSGPAERKAHRDTGEALQDAGKAPKDDAPVEPAETREARSRPSPHTRPLSVAVPRAEGEKPLASPSVRRRAREAGVDLRQVPGTGPAGRIIHDDLDAVFANVSRIGRAPALHANTSVEEVKIIGLRRRIAEKMTKANTHIPHITYVEECDVTALEDLRKALNDERREEHPKLTILPFMMRAIVRAVSEHPNLNANYDDEAGIVHVHGGVHIGIATQTPSGLIVSVVRHAEARDVWDCAVELNRLAEAARSGTISREDVSGSTITITSLGALGGVVTTPIINHPEVAIIGVNKIVVRPVWDGTQFIARKMMNLSSSFDHRVIDGWNAAVFVQRIKTLLETPAMIFVNGQ